MVELTHPFLGKSKFSKKQSEYLQNHSDWFLEEKKKNGLKRNKNKTKSSEEE